MATFKKKSISPAAVAVAEANAASAPIVGDPRLQPSAPDHVNVDPTDADTKVGSSQDVVVGQIIDVRVERVRSNPLNPRAVYTSAAVDEMAVSLSNNGQRVAALGYKEDDGAIVLIEERLACVVHGRPVSQRYASRFDQSQPASVNCTKWHALPTSNAEIKLRSMMLFGGRSCWRERSIRLKARLPKH